MERYEVILRDKRTDYRRSLMFSADDFAHAEEQATDQNSYFDPGNEEIIKIEKEYENAS